VANNIF